MPTENPSLENKPVHAYFASLEIEGIKCFKEKQVLDLSDKNGGYAKWTVILGDNGTGKTTLLQSLALREPLNISRRKKQGLEIADSLNAFDLRNAYWPENVNGMLRSKYFINGELINSEEFKFEGRGMSYSSISYEIETIHLIPQIEMALSGYGASRNMGRGILGLNSARSRAINLFNPSSDLVNAEDWLLQTEWAYLKASDDNTKDILQQKFERIKKVLIKLLPEVSDIKSEDVTVERNKPAVEVQTPYGWVNINDLSFGYQTMIAWTVDFASRMFDAYPNSENPLAEPAVVLVDEIDLHLHPKWQRNIMRELSELFPNTQFIVTAHSPLIVQAADEDTNIVLLRREGDHVVIENDVEKIKGWRVDQILSSDLFENISSRPPEYDAILRERDEIYGKDQLTAKDKERLKEIAKVLDKLPFNADKEVTMLLEEAAKYKKSGK